MIKKETTKGFIIILKVMITWDKYFFYICLDIKHVKIF